MEIANREIQGQSGASVVGCGYWCCAGTERTIPCVVPLSPPKVSSLIVGEFHLSAYLFLKT